MYLLKNSYFYLSGTKILVVFYSSENFSVNKSPFFMLYICRYYSYKDFTILVAQNEKPILMNYINIKNESVIQDHFNKSFKIFPQIGQQMNGFKFRLGVGKEIWPRQYSCTTNNKAPIRNTHFYNYINLYFIFTSYLNLTPVIVKVPLRHQPSYASLKQYKLDISIFDGYVTELSSFLEIWIAFRSNLVAMVPIVQESKINFSVTASYSLIIMITICIFSSVCFRKFEKVKENWHVLDIFGFLLGIGINAEPSKFKAKLLFIVLSFWSIFCISNIVSDITEININTNKVLIADTIEELLENNISVCNVNTALISAMSSS